MKTTLLQGAIINGVINGSINGGIQWFSFKKHETVPISVDSITNQEFTVLGSAVHLSVTLAMILTFVAYFSIKKEMRPKITSFLWLILKHGFFTFGVATGLSVMWQYKMGSIEVSALTGTLLVGLIASVVAGVVNYLTLKPYSETSS
ncbi:hypothetical protein [Robiginitalea marina]|uniref:DUF2871 domain-containing protein n=1 Tax=Robiginitalea marina TaxID=2954105 RepID=A0ABT1B172_9FLAO|nr:hypothetical protein [Robiginitalea marina]MCO5725600.1 hypothetical protein [Robiginitalea marina]